MRNEPYDDLHQDKAESVIRSGVLPSRPEDADEETNFLYDLCLECWQRDPRNRPSSQSVLNRIDAKYYESQLRDEPQLRYESQLRTFLVQHPELDLTGQVDWNPYQRPKSGGFGDVFVGVSLRHNRMKIAIKRVRQHAIPKAEKVSLMFHLLPVLTLCRSYCRRSCWFGLDLTTRTSFALKALSWTKTVPPLFASGWSMGPS